MNFSAFILPLFILIAFFVAFFKKVNVYEGFVSGVNEVIPLLFTIFPYICAVLIMSELCTQSGLTDYLCNALEPAFNFLGIPTPLTPLILIKPLSGSGSVAILADVYKNYGADSYVGKCASCIFSASETVFYVGAVYFSLCKNKKFPLVIAISIISFFATCIFACFICKTV